jgi:hypothetical protein
MFKTIYDFVNKNLLAVSVSIFGFLLAMTGVYCSSLEEKHNAKRMANVPYLAKEFETKMGLDQNKITCSQYYSKIVCSSTLQGNPVKYKCADVCEWVQVDNNND